MEKYRIEPKSGMEFGLYTLGDHMTHSMINQPISAQQRLHEIIDASKLAEDAGLDVFAVGESHQTYFTTQAHTVVLGAIAQATSKIKISSSATVLSVSDPVRIYEDFATLDLISRGRTEIVAGRGSRVGAYDLFGYDLNDYEELFEEKLKLLVKLNEATGPVSWEGQFRAPLHRAEILPQPVNGHLPIWRAVGGPPASAIKAGEAGIPMMLTTLGGPAVNFRASVEAYREAATNNGHDASQLPIATTSLFYTAETSQDAMNEYYPYINAGFTSIRRSGYPKQQFDQAIDYRDALMVGSPQQIIEKLLYQYELFGQQRFMAQIDFGGVPFDKVMKNIELIGRDIIPAVKKYTAQS
ncbi:MAG: LLM class flavin-dependent oxidoreductase [Candidatus Pristimantibacillus lignocellulolyticus]|uniref:LLM class flavin-dependent oxidoreductase n=1 Tax=Candidatus Pristimantibacillus lignocellulolyticus TaxID=2994561 RepID=A0A9J6ZJC0_9BACL|nr:MAG: LLM class flavin-dependent oxidoreductase [Candidatus Pristimantibacillus lignocellulolyticus]